MKNYRHERILKDIRKNLKRNERREKLLKIKQFLGMNVDIRNRKFPVVGDWDHLSRELTSFRKAHNDFFNQPGIKENSELQHKATQTYWHVCYLQKKRMNRHGICMDTISKRRDFSRRRSKSSCIYQDSYSDGRYETDNIREEITATKRYYKDGKEIGKYEFEEIASYFLLTTKQADNKKIICPNCGAISTREALIDGCDFCGTKFSVEDLQDKIGHFSFKEDSEIRLKKQKGIEPKNQDNNTEYKLDQHFYERHGDLLRENDPNFSLFDFFTNIHNKIAMIHYADNPNQVNAFTNIDLKDAMKLHQNIVDLDFIKSSIDMFSNQYPPYEIKDGLQYIRTSTFVYAYELVDGKIVKKHGNISMEVCKVAHCKTPSIHLPSVMTCEGCGHSLSLLDGKTCPMCGKEINLIEKDWVITKYQVWYGTDKNEFK